MVRTGLFLRIFLAENLRFVKTETRECLVFTGMKAFRKGFHRLKRNGSTIKWANFFLRASGCWTAVCFQLDLVHLVQFTSDPYLSN